MEPPDRCSHPDAAWIESKDSVYRHGQNDHRHAALLLSCLSAASCQRKGQDNEYPEDPVEFDYDLWTTEEGKCMVRIKATGEITEVERSVMQVLRSEEKRLRRTISPEQGPSREGKTAPTVLSLDMLPEDVADSSWLADTYDYTEEISTKLLERSLRESLTPTQYGIYQACILNGISYKAYADRMDVSYQSVQNAIRLIQKKAKNIFG